jgi:hypothetical protein
MLFGLISPCRVVLQFNKDLVKPLAALKLACAALTLLKINRYVDAVTFTKAPTHNNTVFVPPPILTDLLVNSLGGEHLIKMIACPGHVVA